MTSTFRPTWTIFAVCIAGIFSFSNLAYDASMINQLLLSSSFVEYFHLNSTYIGLNVALLNLGNIFIAPVAGPLIDWLGRKRAIWAGNLVAIIGVIISVTAPDETVFLVGRCILGCSLTVTATAGSSYVTETTPGHLHALLMSIGVLALPLCGVAAACGGVGVTRSSSAVGHNNWPWRGFLMGELICPVLSSIAMIWAPESPRWLVSRGRLQEARLVLDRIHSGSEQETTSAEREFQEICQTIEFEGRKGVKYDNGWMALVQRPTDRRRFVIVVLTNIIYQTCGANTLPFFFSLIIQGAGVSDTATVSLINLGLAIWGFLSVVAGLGMAQRFGSKATMVRHTAVITACFIVLAVLTALPHDRSRGIGAIVVLFVHWFFSCSCWMFLAYTYPPEVMRFSFRTKGVALGQAIGYVFCLILNYTLPMALETIGWRFYLINAIWDVLAVICMHYLFIETKGRTLEEIDAIFDGHVHFTIDGLDPATLSEKMLDQQGTSQSEKNTTRDGKKDQRD